MITGDTKYNWYKKISAARKQDPEFDERYRELERNVRNTLYQVHREALRREETDEANP